MRFVGTVNIIWKPLGRPMLREGHGDKLGLCKLSIW